MQLEGGEAIALRRKNVQQEVASCEVVGIGSKPELNGRRGKVVDFNPENNRCEQNGPRLVASNAVLRTAPALPGAVSNPPCAGTASSSTAAPRPSSCPPT